VSRYVTRADVAAKVEWEGGVTEALDYGLKVADMPAGDKELQQAWAAAEAAFGALNPAVDVVERLLAAGERRDQAQ
jgi:hypothetical protein